MRAPGRFYTGHTGLLVSAIGATIKIINLDIVLGGGNIVLIATKVK